MSNLFSSQGAASEEPQIDFFMIFNQFWENKWIILLLTSLVFSVGIFFVSRKIPQYQSSIILQIESKRASSSSFINYLSQQQMAGGSDIESTEIALIKSRVILRPVIEALGLDIHVAPKQSRLMRLLAPLHGTVKIKQFIIPQADVGKSFDLVYGKDNHYRLLDDSGNLVLQGTVGQLAVSRDTMIRLFIEDIQADPGNTFELQKVPDLQIVHSLQGQLIIHDLSESKQNTGVLELLLSHPDPKMAVLILNNIAKTVQAKNIRKIALEASKTLEFLNKRLPITKRDLEKSERELNEYRAKNGKIDLKFQGQYLLMKLSDIDKQLSELRISKIDNLQRYTKEHPFIIALETKIREINAERNKLQFQLKKLPASDQIAVNLMRDIKVKGSLYTLLLNKMQELQVLKAGIISDVHILSYATLPNQPLPIKRQFTYVLSIFLGLLLSALVIFSRKLLFPRVDDPRWSERHFNLVNLAIVPYSKEQLEKTSGKIGTIKHIPLLAHINPRNLAIESLRSLRTTLQVRLSCTSNNIVAILGIAPGVGKTFVSANTAYLLATAGKRVVVIDSDMRRGTLHKYFNIASEPGLAGFLNNKNTLEDILIPTVHENLMVIPRGIYPHDPSELLTSERFKQLLDTVSGQFDIVLIDTPPVLLVTDAVLIGVHAGTNYLVVGASAHQPSEIEMTIKRLTNAGVSLDGSIFNFHRQASISGGGYYKYGYKYSYYYDDKESA